MLNSRNVFYKTGMIVVMSDIAIITASAKTTIQEVAKQASALGTGLLNAAPGDISGTPNNSIQYLLAISDELGKIVEQCDKLLSDIAQSKQQKPG